MIGAIVLVGDVAVVMFVTPMVLVDDLAIVMLLDDIVLAGVCTVALAPVVIFPRRRPPSHSDPRRLCPQ